MDERVSFERFVDTVCTVDTMERVRVRYGIATREEYVLQLWRDIVAGHSHHVACMDDIEEKLVKELESAVEYGRRMGYDLDAECFSHLPAAVDRVARWRAGKARVERPM